MKNLSCFLFQLSMLISGHGPFLESQVCLHRPVSLALCVSNVRPDMSSINPGWCVLPRWAFSDLPWEDSIYHGRFQWVFKQQITGGVCAHLHFGHLLPQETILWPDEVAQEAVSQKSIVLRCRDTLLGNNVSKIMFRTSQGLDMLVPWKKYQPSEQTGGF